MTLIQVLIELLTANVGDPVKFKTAAVSNEIVIEAVVDDRNHRWVNIVSVDTYGMEDCNGVSLEVPYLDPPPCGYDYNSADNDIWYYDSYLVPGKESLYYGSRWEGNTFTFVDKPTDYRFKGREREKVQFYTCLVNTVSLENRGCVSWELNNRNQVKIHGVLSQ